jgi:adenylate cyclase
MRAIFTELKRRNVFRVAIAYSVASWLLLQIADLSLGIVDAPAWIIQSLFIVLAVGFVFAVIFSWLYELTPDGLVKESEVSGDGSVIVHTAKKLDYLTIALLVAAVSYLVLDRYVLEQRVNPNLAPNSAVANLNPVDTGPKDNSIAVLPFSDLSPQGDQEYFSDGIAEELLNLLVGVEGLKVASRTSSFAFKGQNINIPDIASKLKVANILEGSVRKAGSKVRITAQLIDTRDDRHLWSGTYDRDLTDIFAIQDEIATAIVDALKQELGVVATSDSIVVAQATDNLHAYDLYLQGRELFLARQSLALAIELFQRAIELDPNYAKAWEGLAAVHRVADDWLVGDGIEHVSLSMGAARQALSLDPDLSLPYAVLADSPGVISAETGRSDFAESLRLYDLAIEKDPNNTTAWLWRGIELDTLGYFDRAIADFDQCIARDPAYLNCIQHRAAALLYRGETDAALEAFLPTVFKNYHSMCDVFVPVLVDEGDSLAAVLLAFSKFNRPYVPAGEWVEALEHPERDHSAGLARLDRWAMEEGYDYSIDVPIALLAFKAYERAAQSPGMRYVLHSPAAKAFRQTDYFKQFVYDNGIEDHWREYGFPPHCQLHEDQSFSCD